MKKPVTRTRKKLTVKDIFRLAEESLNRGMRAVLKRQAAQLSTKLVWSADLVAWIKGWIAAAHVNSLVVFLSENDGERWKQVDADALNSALDYLGPAVRASLLGLETPEEGAPLPDMLPWVRERMEQRDWEGLIAVAAPHERKEGDGEIEPWYDIEVDFMEVSLPPRWMRPLTMDWLLTVIQMQENAIKLQMATYQIRAHGHYVKLPKVTAGIAWAMGRPGREARPDEFSFPSIEAGFAKTPGIARLLLPRSGLIQPEDLKHTKFRAHTLQLPFAEMEEPVVPLAVAIGTARQNVLSLPASKIGSMLLAILWNNRGRSCMASLREIHQVAYPNQKLRASAVPQLLEALKQLDTASIAWKTGWTTRLFHAQQPASQTDPDRDQPILLGLHPELQVKVAQVAVSQTGPPVNYNGEFIFNMKALELQSAGCWVQYMAAAAMFGNYWDYKTGKPKPGLIPAMPLEGWAQLTNYMPDESLAVSDGARRVAKSTAIKQLMADTEELGAMGLIQLINPASEWKAHGMIIHPTEDHLDAWARFRAGELNDMRGGEEEYPNSPFKE
jgi:hypothetical protein